MEQSCAELQKGDLPKPRKPRFTFSVPKDIIMLKALLTANPWEYGDEQWEDVVKLFKTRSWIVTTKTLKNRLKILQQQLKVQSMSTTGTEEERTERAHLLLEIENLEDAANTTNNLIIIEGATENGDEFLNENDDCPSMPGQEQPIEKEVVNKDPETFSKKQKLSEKKRADSDRDKALNCVVSDVAPEANGTRAKRPRLMEEELIMKKQSHDMEIEDRKIFLEEQKERRLLEEGRRRDELTKCNIDLQQQQLNLQQSQVNQQQMLMEILTKFINK